MLKSIFVVFAFLVLALLLTNSVFAQEDKALVALDECPKEYPACFSMPLDPNLESTEWDEFKKGTILGTKEVKSRGFESEPGTLLTLRIQGGLEGKPKAKTLLNVRGAGGLSCSYFGTNLEVATIGFTLSGHPIILTDKGRFEVDDPQIMIGRKGSMVIIDRTTVKIERKILVPDAVVDLVPINTYTIDQDMTTYYRKKDECIRLTDNSLLAVVDKKYCKAMNFKSVDRTRVKETKEIRGYDLYESDMVPFYVGYEPPCT